MEPTMMGMCGKGGCMMGGGGHHLASVLMAATAVLGYWALRWSDKDSGPTRFAGQAVGWVLVVFGLGGFLCGSLSHGAKMAGAGRSCAMGSGGGAMGMGGMQMPPGHPPVGGMTDEAPAKKTK